MKSLLLLLSISLLSAFGFAQDCASVTIAGGSGQVNITGVSAPIATVQVFNSSWASVFNQTYTNSPGNVTVSPLAPGQYFVNVHFYNSNWSSICEKGANATVTSGSPAPVDSCKGTYLKTIGVLAGDDEGYNIVKTNDGGFFVVGHGAASGTTNDDAFLMKLNANGTLLWSKTLGGPQEDYFNQIVVTADGGCLVSGATNVSDATPYSGDPWLVRFDGSGNILWQKRYFISGITGTISSLIQTSDGGFAFCGAVPNNPGVSDWMVAKIDASGNIQWQRKLGAGNSDGANCLVEDNHGTTGLVVAGVFYGTSLYDMVISKLDLATGSLTWMKTYDFDTRSSWPILVHKVSDGFVFTLINADGFAMENGRDGLFKTDFNGNSVWMKEYPLPTGRDVRTTLLPDGGFMMVQGELPHDASSDLHFQRIDANGNLLWAKKYTRAGAQWLWNMITDGNSVMGIGMATQGSYNDVLLAKIDFNGKMGNCTATNEAITQRNAVINPINFTWPTNTALNMTASNTTYTQGANNPVENVLCAEGCPTITISSPTVNENAGNAVLQVCIAAPSANTLVYQYSTSNGTAISGSDYTGGSGTVTILAGQTCGTISIPITNDTDIELAETFTVSIGAVSGTVTINDDDDQPQINCNNVTFTPGNNLISVSGITAPIATVQVFNSSWASVFNQTYNNQPGTVNVPIGAGTYLVKVTFYNANWGYICDKSENVTVVNNCPAGTICVSNICPSQTVNLNTAYSIPNLPAGTTVSWHTGTPATDANKMTDQEAQNVSVSGTYYAAIHISGGCYSATIPVTVTIIACSSADMKSNVVQAAIEGQSATKSVMAFPNPFTGSLKVVIDSEKKEKATLVLMDVQGRPLKQMPVQLMPGSNTVSFDGLDRLASGNYFLRISSGNEVKTLKVIRQQ